MTTWALIPCSKTKADHPCAAREMYWPSPLFQGAWKASQARGETPLILSAKHGLLDPDTVIEPYDQTLKNRPRRARRMWGYRVCLTILQRLKDGTIRQEDTFVSYLGALYAADIVPCLRQLGFTVEEPLKGMKHGKRLHELKGRMGEAV